MGGCATKPKVLKDAAAGAPMPEAQKEESAEDLTAVKEGAAGADDEANKRRSLSNLFKESEEKKSLEDGKDETYETEQASNPKETEKPKCAEEQTPAPAPVVDDAPAKTEAQEMQEVASIAEVPEEKIEDVKPKTEGKKDETPEMRSEEKPPTEDSQKSETPVEKKTEENQHPGKKTEEEPATPQIEDKKPPSTLEKTMEN